MDNHIDTIVFIITFIVCPVVVLWIIIKTSYWVGGTNAQIQRNMDAISEVREDIRADRDRRSREANRSGPARTRRGGNQ